MLYAQDTPLPPTANAPTAPASDAAVGTVNPVLSSSGSPTSTQSRPLSANEQESGEDVEAAPASLQSSTFIGAESEPVVTGSAVFSLPGGYGRAPETLEFPVKAADRRPPLRFSFDLSEGYDDNVLQSSGVSAPAASASQASVSQPIIGSFFTNATAGVNYNALTQGHFLNVDANLGGTYYLDRPGGNFDENGVLRLTGATKLGNRAQLSAFVLAGYYAQPNLALVNAPTKAGQGGYIETSTLIDYTYRWTKRFESDTTLLFGSRNYIANATPGSDFATIGIGQALLYKLTHAIDGVIDLRAERTAYNSGAPSETEAALLGVDAKLPSRTAFSFRAGETFQQFGTPGSREPTSPFIESNVTRQFGKGAQLEWINRYGFENSGSADEVRLTYRTGLHGWLKLSGKLNALLAADYSNSNLSDVFGVPEGHEHTIDATAGLDYRYSRRNSFYIRYTRLQVIESSALSSYSENRYFVGASWLF